MRLTRHVVPAIVMFLFCTIGRAENVETYHDISDWSPYFGGELGKTYVAPTYEYSRIHVGASHMDWHIASIEVLRPFVNTVPYLNFTYYDRNDSVVDSIAAGSYFKLDDNILQVEIGFGTDSALIYQSQMSVEYQYHIKNGFFAKFRAKYIDYKARDVGIGSPVGFIYYFGNHYVTADYSFSVTEGRGVAHWCSVKGNFVLNPRWELYTGAAVGQRLFDMQEIDASKEGGFITFAGFRYRIFENTQLTCGGSYSEEQPNFSKRSIDAGLSVKF